MYLELAQDAMLYRLLHAFDVDLAAMTRARGCGYCGGRLDSAAYPRQPRGGPSLPDVCLLRLSLCCAAPACRRRTLPPSCLFLGRRVYWGVVVVLVVALRQGRVDGALGRDIRRQIGVSPQTLSRWMVWFRDVFPTTPWWRRLRGRAGMDVHDDALPVSLLSSFEAAASDAVQALATCLRFLANGGP